MPKSPEGMTPSPETKESKVEAESQAQIVTALLEGKPVYFTYNEHYGVYLHFNPDGTTDVEDQGEEYKLQRGDKTSALAGYIDEVWTVVDKMRESLPTIPKGNLSRDLGGQEGLAGSYLNVERANRYLEASKEQKGKE